MKKTKAKPVKGSARVKKFDDGGLAALAGLGALAYLMRKKKGDSEASVPTDKSGYSSGPVDVRKMIEGSRDDEDRTPSATKFGGASNLGKAIEETGTRPGPDTAEPKPAPKPKARTASQTFPLNKPTPAAKTTVKKVVADTEEPVKLASQGSFKFDSATPTSTPAKEVEKPKKRGGIGPYHAFEGVTDYFSKLREGRKRPGEMKKGGKVKKYASGGSVSSASKRADGIAQRGKTKGRIC